MELFEFILLIIERVFWSDGILYLFWVPTLRIPYKTRIPSMYRFPMTDWYFLRNARPNSDTKTSKKGAHIFSYQSLRLIPLDHYIPFVMPNRGP